MGYRSEVFMMISADSDAGNGERTMAPLYAMIDARGVDLDSHWSPSECKRHHGCFVFHTENVKWYPSFPEVKEMEWIYETGKILAGQDHKISGVFIRIGENCTDIEESCFGEEHMDDIGVEVRLNFPAHLLND
jgi:hypothetical protein